MSNTKREFKKRWKGKKRFNFYPKAFSSTFIVLCQILRAGLFYISSQKRESLSLYSSSSISESFSPFFGIWGFFFSWKKWRVLVLLLVDHHLHIGLKGYLLIMVRIIMVWEEMGLLIWVLVANWYSKIRVRRMHQLIQGVLLHPLHELVLLLRRMIQVLILAV